MISTDTKYLQTTFTTRSNLYALLAGWGVNTVRSAVDAHDEGSSFVLSDGLLTVASRHPRIFGPRAQRRAPPLGLQHEVTGGDRGPARRAREGFAAALKQHVEPKLGDIVDGLGGMGFQVLQTTWVPSADASTLDPVTTLFPSPSVTWNPWYQRLEAITAEGGRVPIVPGDGKWEIVGTGAKPWLRGAVRALAEGWASSRYAERDEAALSAYLGRLCPIGIAPVNIQPNTPEGDAFRDAVQGLGEAQSGGIFPFGSEVTTLPNVDAGAAALFEGFLDRRAAGFEIVILGAPRAGSTPGVYLSPQYGEVTASIVRSDTTTISAALTRIGAVYGALNYGLSEVESPSHRWLLPDTTEAERVKATADAYTRAAAIVNAERLAGLDMTPERLAVIYGGQGIPAPSMPITAAKAQIFAYHLTTNTIAIDEVRETLGVQPLPGGVGSPEALAAHILAVRAAELAAAQGGAAKQAAPAEPAPEEG
jgi:hypothetical protein